MLFNPKFAVTQHNAIAGRFLAHANLTASQSAGIAGQLVAGEIAVEKMTIAQACALTGANKVYASAAAHASAEQRAALAAGRVTVQSLPPSTKTSADPADALVAAWNAAPNDVRVAFASRVGVATIWDTAIAPALD